MGVSGHVKGPQTYHDLSKQHRQNEAAGQVDVSTRFEVHMMGYPRHVLGPQMSHRLPKNNIDRMN